MIPVVGKKYKIVKSLCETGSIEWIIPMYKYVGRICTVVYVQNDNDSYDKWARIDIDEKTWCWDFSSFVETDVFSDKDFLL